MNPTDDIFDLWDCYHPRDSDDDDGNLFPENGDWEDLEDLPQIPTIDRVPEVVDYSERGPNDFVVSGPLGTADKIQGRRFDTRKDALEWAVAKYGKNRVKAIDAGEWKWAVLIRAA